MNKKDTHNEPARENTFSDSMRVNPFSIPDNFFNVQEKSIIAQLSIEKVEQPTASASYTVPKGYFDVQEKQILTKIFESKLKDQTPTIAYEVPDGYFDSLVESIQSRIFEQDLKAAIPKDGFNIPSAYFEDQSYTIQAKITADKLKSKVAKEGFVVPENYFDTLSAAVLNSIGTNDGDNEEATIVQMSNRRTWFSYASAAAVVFIIGIGSYFALQQQTDTSSNVALSADMGSNPKVDLGDISNDEIVDYLAQVSEGEELFHLTRMLEQETSSQDQINRTIDDEDIKEYLNYML